MSTNTHRTPQRNHRLDRPTVRRILLASIALLITPATHAASITFSAATTIASDTDVFAVGGLTYAFDLSNSAQTVNGVIFAAGNSATTLGGGNITMSGFDGANNTNAFGSASGNPWNGLSGAYKVALQGGNYTAAGTTATVNLNNLSSGHIYATQVWVNDNRDLGGGLSRSEVISSSGGNSIMLDYNSTNGNGGVGQFTIGSFTADATTQAFTLLANNAGSQSSQLNAVQVRDVTGVWSGATSGNWDSASGNFTGGNSFGAITGLGTPVTAVYFADTDGFRNAVTNNNVTVQAGGVSIGTVNFQNETVNYTVSSADSNGITGVSAVNKSGTGTVTFAGANTYAGTTTISAGTLQVGIGGNTGTLGSGAVTNNGSLVFFRNDAAQLNMSSVISGSGSVAYNGPAVAVSTQGQFLVDDTNTYTGATTISNARVNVTNSAAFGSGAGAVVTVNNGGQIYTAGAVTLNNPIIINGNGWVEGAGTLGAIRMNGGTIAGSVTMASNSRISSYGGSGTISGVISGGFNLEVTGQGIGNTITLTGANTYTGTTTINVGTLQIGVGGTTGQFGGTGNVINNAALSLNRSDALLVGNAISGTGSLTKTGAGTTTLTASNTYAGTTSINAGTLAIAGGGIANSSDFTVGNSTGTAAGFSLGSGTVTLGGANLLTASAGGTPVGTVFTYTQTGGALNFTNAGGFIGMSNNGGTTNLNISGGTFTAGNTSGMNLGVRGDANLNLTTAASVTLPTLTFGHPSTAGGTSTVNLDGGTLAVGAGRIVKGSGTAVFNFNGGTLQPTAASATFMAGLNTANVRNSGAIINVANGNDITIGQALVHSTIGSDNATDGGLTKNGNGVLTLSGTNTYTGATIVSGGTLKAGSDAALGASGGAVTVASGASLDINGRTLQGYTQDFSIAGAGTAPTLGALGNSGGANVNAIRGITLTANASIGGNGGRWDIGRLDFNVNPAITVDHITGNGFVLTKVGSSYLGLLTGAVNLAGFVVNGGTVAPHENTAFGAGPVTVNPGATVKPWGGTTFANAFNLAGGTLENDGFSDTYNGAINVTATSTLNALPGGNILLNGNITGAGGLMKTGGFSIFLSGNNSGYSGTYTNNVSNTFFGAAAAGSSSAAFVVNAGNLASTASGTLTIALGSLAGTGGSVGNNGGTAVTFNIGGNNTNASYAGSIVNSVGGGGTTALIKSGTGTQTLIGANSYTGGTTIDGGTLEAAAGGALGGTVNVAINTGGTLLLSGGGTNRINDAATITMAGGTIAFSGNATEGSSPGTGALTLTANSIIDFAGGNDVFNFGASGTGNPNPWTALTTLSIYNWGGSSVGGGSDRLIFGSAPGDNSLTASQLAQISFYDGGLGSNFLGTGTFVGSLGEVVPVPEPSSIALAIGLLGLIGWRERRQAGEGRAPKPRNIG